MQNNDLLNFAKERQHFNCYSIIADSNVLGPLAITLEKNYNLKHLSGTDGLYEIRVQAGNNIYRVFCFFDVGNLVILLSGFQKKDQRTPKKEIKKAEKLKQEYYESK